MTEQVKKVHVDKGREGKLIPTKVLVIAITIAVLVVLAVGIVFGLAGFSAIANNEHTRQEAITDAKAYASTVLALQYLGQTFVEDGSDQILVIGDKLTNSYYKYQVDFESVDYEITLEVNYETGDIVVHDVDVKDRD